MPNLRRSLITLILLICTLFPGLPVSHASTSDAPYLYYYSTNLNAFIIERADGTDSRVLGRGMTTGVDAITGREAIRFVINGPGWSPSGRWLAWTASASLPGSFLLKPYAVSSDGKRKVTALDQFEDASLAWTPNTDMLLAVSLSRTYLDSLTTTITIALINPDENSAKIVHRIKFYGESMFTSVRNPYVIQWHSDDRATISLAANLIPQMDNKSILSFAVDLSAGFVTSRVFALNDSYETPYEILSKPYTSSAGDAANIEKTYNRAGRYVNSLVVENPFTSQQFVAELPFEYAYIHWSPTQPIGLLIGKTPIDGVNAYVIEPQKRLATPLFPVVPKHPHYWTSVPDWSADGKYAVLISETHVYLYSTSSNKVTSLLVLDESQSVRTYEDGYTEQRGWNWDDQNRLALIVQTQLPGQDEYYECYIFDPASGELTPQISRLSSSIGFARPVMSPDQQYLATIVANPVIAKLGETESVHVTMTGSAVGTFLGGNVIWSTDSNWLITLDVSSVAGGGGSYVFTVIDVQKGLNRELSESFLPSRNTINWLPSHVDPDSLPPFEKILYPRPLKTLKGVNNSPLTHLLFSPDSALLGHSSKSDLISNQWLAGMWSIVTEEYISSSAASLTNQTMIEWKKNATSNNYVLVYGSPEKHLSEVWSLGSSGDGKLDVRYLRPQDEVPYYAVFESAASALILRFPDIYHSAMTTSFSPDNRFVAIGDYRLGGRGYIWEIATGEPIAAIPHGMGAVAFSPDGKYFACANGWDVELYDAADLTSGKYKSTAILK